MTDQDEGQKTDPSSIQAKPNWIFGSVQKIKVHLQEHRAKKKQESSQNRSSRLTANATVWIALLTFAVLFVGVFQYRTFDGQLTEMRAAGRQTDELIKANKTAAEAAKQSAELSYEVERGRIQIQNVTFSNDDPPVVNYVIVNIGRTPITLILSRMKVEKIYLGATATEAAPRLPYFTGPFAARVYGGKVLDAKETIPEGRLVGMTPPSGTPAGRSAWFFRGEIIYQDIFGKEYKRGFCFRSALTCAESGHAMTGTSQGQYNYEKQQPPGNERINWPT